MMNKHNLYMEFNFLFNFSNSLLFWGLDNFFFRIWDGRKKSDGFLIRVVSGQLKSILELKVLFAVAVSIVLWTHAVISQTNTIL